MTTERALVLLSGGLDSAVALWWAKRRWDVYALTFRYGKLNSNEVRSARKLAKRAGVTHHFLVDVAFLKQVSELEGRHVAQELDLKMFPPTYVPGRNTVYFGIAAHYAEIYGLVHVVTGHLANDPFPDSKLEYIAAMNNTLSQGSWLRKKQSIRITAPFSGSTKEEIVKLALKLDVPIDLTWSCHRNWRRPCGKCQGCLDRLGALVIFRFAPKR